MVEIIRTKLHQIKVRGLSYNQFKIIEIELYQVKSIWTKLQSIQNYREQKINFH